MTKRMVLYEAEKICLLFLELLCIAAIGFCSFRVLQFALRLAFALAPITYEQTLTVASSVPENLSIVKKVILFFATQTTKQQAIRQIILFVAAGAALIGLLVVFRLLLRSLERRFKQRYMPDVLENTFSDFTYEAKRKAAREEHLCEMGLLSRVERYYTANRLEGLYRDCWVASQEIVCGGVYRDHYTSHSVKVRGQCLTIRLNFDFKGTVILERRGTANRFSHRGLAGSMCELMIDHQELAANFACYTDSVEDAKVLLTAEMAEKILSMLDRYPDFCVFFQQGCMYVLIRRRSFNRRWELACPFCYPQLRREAARLYGSLQEFTDMLLE